ncbi:DUF2254 domain-containing protein [Rhodococcus sp. AQ5-07]|uniref:DUF2254 domain-containing protein n=1 Tax=Rhodococcus sp. AQ5-07 TaxID=2054902 RepID=UPI000DBFFE7F|nr:DUF2254 domain-containing protein [Rhodococcus sp. AQ5-07]RAL30840.1 DUF2254 domain-containing protein [Rhodococcus sp. AQ5-07]
MDGQGDIIRTGCQLNRYFASARDATRTKLWPLPVVGVLLAVAAGVSLPYLDAYVDAGLPSWSTAITFGGDAGAARTLLAAIASSLITVTALTFSLTVVTLQLASSQFSPRLLRTFTSDIFVQTTLAIFLSTFTFALTVLRAVRSGDQGGAFVPQISVTVAFALSIASVLALVLFLAHLARQIRVETLLRDVHEEIIATVRLATNPLEDARPQPTILTPPPHALQITAPSSGFLTSIDEAELRAAAIQADGYLIIDCHPGSSLIEGVPIGAAWTAADRPDEALDRLQHAVRKSIKVGYERTAAQDIGYGLRQLSDVVNKAVSPGINDPTTAVHALGHISAILCQLANRDLRSIVLRGDDDEVRVVLHRPSFAEMVDVAVTQPRRYGASDPQVMERLFRLLEELAWHAADESTIRGQLARLRATVARSDFDDTELTQLERAGAQVEHAITHQPDQNIP